MAQRQFQSGDSSNWAERFGDGSDGVLTISSDQTFNATNASCSGSNGSSTLTVASTTGFAEDNLILIYQTRGTNAGAWELNKVSSVGAGILNLSYHLLGTYTDSGDSQAQVILLKQYSGVTVNSGVTWSAPLWDGNIGGVIAFLCNGTTTISGTFSVASKGYNRNGQYVSNGAGNQGEGTNGIGSQQQVANGNGGGGGEFYAVGSNPGGGGGGNLEPGTDGVDGDGGKLGGAGGNSSGETSLATMTFGGEGGAGGSKSTGNGSGGEGGGIVLIISKTITVSGSITANAHNGYSGTDSDAGGGGGGAGGSILLKGQTVTLGTNLVTANAGTGGSGAGGGRNGGAGAVGRIHIDYSDSVTGTTSPTLDSSLENILSDTATTTSTTTTSTSTSSSTTTTSTSTTLSSTSTTTTSTSTSVTTTSTSTTTTSTSTTTTSTSTTTTSTSVPREFSVDNPAA